MLVVLWLVLFDVVVIEFDECSVVLYVVGVCYVLDVVYLFVDDWIVVFVVFFDCGFVLVDVLVFVLVWCDGDEMYVVDVWLVDVE